MKTLGVIFLLVVLALVGLADAGELPPEIRALYSFPYGDKFGHFVLFGLLAFFLTRGFLLPLPTLTRRRVLVTTGIVLALGLALEEWSQQFFSARTFDLIDLLASYSGCVIGGWIGLGVKK